MDDEPAFPPCGPDWHDYTRSRLRLLPSGEGFPTRDQLWRGAVLATLVQVAYSGGDDYEWYGPTLVIYPSSGDYGTLTFAGDAVIGLFFSHEDDRSPWPEGRPPYNQRPYLRGISTELMSIASRYALPQFARPLWSDSGEQYTISLERGQSTVSVGSDSVWVTAFTAAFWGRGERMGAAEPWPEVFEHGAFVIETLLLEPHQALTALADNFSLSAHQAGQVWDVYERRVAQTDGLVPMTYGEWEELERESRENWDDWRPKNAPMHQPTDEQLRRQRHERFEWARSMLKAVDIHLMPD